MSNARPTTDAAARARIVTELDRNFLVEAGAGSGKTHELASRMAAGIASGAYELERMAAVTFTRKAAAELRGRFQLALEAELKRPRGSFLELAEGASRETTPGVVSAAGDSRDSTPGVVSADDAARAARLTHALSNLERFFAGTIHAFCARLLRERPVEAGVSPGFTELDDVEERLVRQQSWRDYRAQAKATGDADLLELLDAGITAKQLDDAFETICLYEDVTFPPGDAPMPDSAAAWKALESFWTSVESMLPVPIAQDSTCKTQERAERFKRQWRARARGLRNAALLADLLRTWQSKPAVVQRCWPSKTIAKSAEQLHADFRDAVVVPYLTSWRQYLYGRCVGLLTKARDAAKAERRRRNALSFNDLLIMTADVLRTNAGVRRALQDKYHWLLVDEFQDTDPVQAEIMFLLAAAEEEGDAAGTKVLASAQCPAPSAQPCDWRAVPLRPGALFVVGDPKQSIYRFRRADIDIYNEVRTRLGGAQDEGLVRLTTNFRSVPGLCDWANAVFQVRFPAAPTMHAPMFAALDSSRAAESGPSVAVIELPADLDGSDLANEEAARIARFIRAEVDAKRRTYGDFLILTRKKKGLKPYANALEALEVPIEVTGAGAFGESEEVRALALLLTALSDPQDAVALVGVLRGPLFGISDRELFAFRQSGGWFSLFADGVADGGAGFSPPSPVGVALSSLRRYHRWTRRLPAGAALELILEDSGYLALGATSHGGVEAGDLLHAVDRVRAAIESGFTLAEAASALAAWSGLEDDGPDESTEVDSLPLEPGRRDVVRLMNLHKAKGLEAAVVFLADPLGGFEPHVDVRIVRAAAVRRADRSVVRQSPDALGYFQIVDGWGYSQKVLAEPAGWDAHQAAEQEYLDAEADRLLYVAATRARDTLVVGRWSGKPGRRIPAWAAFNPHIANAPALAIPAHVAPSSPERIDLGAAAAVTARTRSEVAHDRVRRPSWASTSVTAEIKRLPRVAVEATDAAGPADLDPTRALLPHTPSHRADAGLAWGALVHGLLEHAMRHRAATRDDLRLAMWLTVEEPSLRVVIERALDTVQSVAAATFWQEARQAAEHHEEAPFAIRDASSSPPRVVTGTIDLVHRTAHGWRVVDYKTDVDLGDPEAQGTYAAQVSEYAKAWGRIAAAPVTTAVVAARE